MVLNRAWFDRIDQITDEHRVTQRLIAEVRQKGFLARTLQLRNRCG